MPHVSRWEIDGVIAPSVNQVTDMIPKEWLINWYRKVGFKKADEISRASRDKGTDFHDLFDRFWKGQVRHEDCTPVELTAVKSLTTWAAQNKIEVLASEPHLESRKYKFHGSPDLIAKKPSCICNPDYKFKDKYPDYKTVLNGVAYSLMWEEMYGHKIKEIIVLNFSKETGEMLQEIVLPLEEQYKADFLLLRAAWDVKSRADAWDEKYIRSKFKKSA